MIVPSLRRTLFVLAAAPLALGLASCGKQEAGTEPPKGEAIAKIAAPAGKAWSEVVEETPEGGVRMGNPEAPIKLIEYGSLTCPHCKKFSEDGFATLVGNYVGSGRVSFEFRSFAIHPQDVPLTVLVRCAPKEAFFPLVEAIYSNFEAMNAVYGDKATLDKAQATMQLGPAQRWVAFSDTVGYTKFFTERGVPLDQAHACLADPTRAKQVADNAQQYGNDGVNGTPTLLINGVKVDSTEWAVVEVALQNAGAR